MVDKKLFVKCIKTIQEQSTNEEKFEKGIEGFCDGWVVIENKSSEMLVELLEWLFNDNNEYISWWLWEDVPKIIYLDDGGDVKVKIDTPEKLYDLLVGDLY